ncbi:MAG: tagaturonate epimerase family protein, partial [Armatimonadota bacterium]
MKINGIELKPEVNPAVLDTFTWDISAAAEESRKLEAFLMQCAIAVGTAHCAGCLRGELVDTQAVLESAVLQDGTGYFLVNLSDGQKLLAAVSPKGVEVPGEPVASYAGGKVALLPVNTETVKWYVTRVAPRFSPRAFGSQPRLGIGGRQTVTVWPGIIKGLETIGGPAETIQNSAYRELAPMEMILSPPGEEVTYLPGHGSLNIGHTGSSIEGFWLAGVVSHIENGCAEPYGADLDHVPVKAAGEAGLSKARRLIDCGRHFTFFTLDTSALFDFSTDDLSSRYDAAIDAAAAIFDYIRSIKRGEAFDFEFSLDEGPGLTQPQELEYVLKRLTDSGVTVNFIAPNVGFEKRLDYRLPDGVAGLEARVREMSRIASGYGALLDFHSGSDKSPETYRAISRACDGRLKLKVSGKL